MTQVLITNDTGADIAAGTTVTLDGVFGIPDVEEIVSGSLINLYDGSTTAGNAATPTTIAATTTYKAGNYVYLASPNTIKLGVVWKQYQLLLLNVNLKDEVIRT